MGDALDPALQLLLQAAGNSIVNAKARGGKGGRVPLAAGVPNPEQNRAFLPLFMYHFGINAFCLGCSSHFISNCIKLGARNECVSLQHSIKREKMIVRKLHTE